MVTRARQQVAGDVELLRRAHEHVVRVSEETLDVRREQRVLADLDASVQNASNGRAHRRDGASAMEELVA